MLQVHLEGQPYITDVGFGGLTLTTPLVLIPNLEQETSLEPFRFIETDRAYMMQAFIHQEWISLYRFDLQEQQLPDYEVSNWYVSTHPNSIFVNGLIAAKPDVDRRYALRNNQFTVHYLEGRTERRTLATVAELRATLENAFGLNLDAIADLDQALQQVIERVA